jgi:hypothetical protein
MRGLEELSESPHVVAGGGGAEVLAAAHVRTCAAAAAAAAAAAGAGAGGGAGTGAAACVAVAGVFAGALERIADALGGGGAARGRDDPPHARIAAEAEARARSDAFRCRRCGGAVGAAGRAAEVYGWDARAGAPACVMAYAAEACVCRAAAAAAAASVGGAAGGAPTSAAATAAAPPAAAAAAAAARRVTSARVVDVRRVKTCALRFAVEAASVVLRIGGYVSLVDGAVHSEAQA